MTEWFMEAVKYQNGELFQWLQMLKDMLCVISIHEFVHYKLWFDADCVASVVIHKLQVPVHVQGSSSTSTTCHKWAQCWLQSFEFVTISWAIHDSKHCFTGLMKNGPRGTLNIIILQMVSKVYNQWMRSLYKIVLLLAEMFTAMGMDN